jgi:4-diphosphocytidyl-2-C-methyl-D-erythritol kinase
VHGLFQSIAWPDSLVLDGADEDRIEGRGSGEVIDGWDNLAWRAATMVRELAQSSRALRIELHKRIPVAAGLGGGSADAAAALGLAGRFFGVSAGALAELAPQIGSDVPFCLGGGLAVVSGTGEKVSTLEPAAGFAMALVVPPIELATVDVYSAWDRLEDQRGPGIADRDLPPSLRSHGPLVNDLYGAAVAVAPAIDEWRAELADRWGRPVMLTGSGPTLFAYFVDTTEAESALDAVPIGARATRAAVPVSSGWQMVNEESRIENRESR